jgi:hypothetical protein
LQQRFNLTKEKGWICPETTRMQPAIANMTPIQPRKRRMLAE